MKSFVVLNILLDSLANVLLIRENKLSALSESP